MSYNDKLAQTGKRVASARRKYYGSFDYGSGLGARLRGGTFSFGRRFGSGSSKGEEGPASMEEWYNQYFGDDWVYEPDVDALTAGYWNEHPDEFKQVRGLNNAGLNSKGNWGSAISGAIEAIGTGVSEAQLTRDQDAYMRMINGTYMDSSGVTDNSGLIAMIQNAPRLSQTTAQTFDNKTSADVAKSALSAAGSGALAGASFGPWGALIGAGIGAASSLIGSGIRKYRARNASAGANSAIERKNKEFNTQIFHTGQSVDARNDWTRMLGYYSDPYELAFGGPLHSNGGDFNGGLTYIDEGGRHEDNPYEGVPSGVGADGVPNLVEEGEVIWNNDYVFSDRLKVPKKLAKKYKLGGDKDYTFAEAIEKLTKENTISPNDFITIATTKEIVNEFMDAQETLREREQIKAREELEAAQADDFLAQLDAAQGMAPQGMALPPAVGIPNEAPVTEGEMTPPGYALGGRMFKNGSKKEGEVKLPEGMKVVYSKGRNGQRGPVHHYESADGRNLGSDLNRAIQLFNAGNAATERRSPYIFGDGYEPPLRAASGWIKAPWWGEVNQLNYSLFFPDDKAEDTDTPITWQNYSTIPFSDIYEYINYDPGKPYVPSSEVIPPPSQAPAPAQAGTQASVLAPTPAGSPSSGTPQTGTRAAVPQSGSGSSGNGSSSSARGIKYNRKINGKEFESQQHYQDFISSMDRLKTQDPAKAQEWIDYINQAIKDQGDKYHISSFEDWRDLALDGKVGPVHQATLKAAEYFARRAGAQAVGSGNPIEGEPTLESVLGVKPQTAKGIPSVGTQQTGTTGATDTKVSTTEPRFKYRDTSLRYAPPIGAAMDLLYRRLNRPDYSNADHIIEASGRMGMPINIPVETIGDYRRRNPYDERYLVNLANQNRAAGVRTLANTAGGNRSMDMLGAMSLAHSNQYDLGEIMRQAYLANRQDDAQVAEFNRGTNLYNMNAINQRNLSQAQINTHRQQAGLSGLTQGYGLRQNIRDNWEDSAMESYNSLLASLGAIGKENEEYNMLQSMAEEGYFDHAYIDNGRIRFVPRTVTAKGGKLNRKKRRF